MQSNTIAPFGQSLRMGLQRNAKYLRMAALLLLLAALFSISPTSAAPDATPDLGFRQSTLRPADIRSFDNFGHSVDISSEFAAIGAPSHDIWNGKQSLENVGAVYIYQKIKGYWQFSAKLVPPSPQAHEAFGASLSLRGRTLAIGAVGRDSVDFDDVGAVYIYNFLDEAWHFDQRLESGADEQSEHFGSSLNLDGKMLVIGAPDSDQSGVPDAGAAYVYVGDTYFVQQDILTSTSPKFRASFGHSVDTDGLRIIVGSPGEGNAGGAYIYERNALIWTMSDYLSPSDGRNGDFFGASVSIDEDRVAVGATFKDPAIDAGRVTGAGGVYVFKKVSPGWKEEAIIELAEPESFDHFGNSIDLKNRILLIGARGRNNFGTISSGAAYTFERTGGNWAQGDYFFPQLAQNNDTFGQAVATNGHDILIGAIGRDPSNLSSAGEAFLFDFDLLLPSTGFSQLSPTMLNNQPANLLYSETDLTLSVPDINIASMPIVAVPLSASGWDTRWLAGQAGFLESTAFPTLPGNTVLTGHVWDANNQPGPFAEIHNLQYGDEVIISAWGQSYVYEVRSSELVDAANLTVLHGEKLDWITLITCEGYDESTQNYFYRRAVKAVLTRIEN